MPVLADRTREQIRVAIGYNLGAVFLSTADSGDSASVVDGQARGNIDTENGKWIVSTSGANDGEIRQVIDTVVSSNGVDMTVDEFTNSVSTMTYERWSERYNPVSIHEFINTAVLGLYGRAYNPDEYPDVTSSSAATALHGAGSVARFDIPSGFSMINRLEYRSSFTSTSIHSCDAVFDESGTSSSTLAQNANITATADTEDKKQGTASNRFVYAAGASAGDKTTDSITSKDISGYDYIEGWVKIALAAGTSAGNLKILLDDTVRCASPLEELNVPALTNDTWTYFRVPLATPELDTAIISVGLEYDADLTACTVWIDDLKAVKNDEAVWTPVSNRLWHIDKNTRDLILSSAGRSTIGYSMMKIVGGDEPTLLTADATANEVSDDYVIAKATALALSAYGPENERTERQIAMWEARASQAYRRLPMLTNVRVVE
jgi:hypothetical protein